MAPRTRPKKKPRQPAQPRSRVGGRRAGAGRKPNGEKAGVGHGPRALVAARFPTRVTMKLRPGLPPLRTKREYAALRTAFAAGCDRFGFRLTHYQVMNDHLHFLVEARDRATLARGLQGLSIRIAKALNKLWQTHGTVFGDRYDARVLKTPREVRDALVALLANGDAPAAEGREVRASLAVDTFTSAPWFDGFRETVAFRGIETIPRPVANARTWLLTIGWRRHGLLSVHDRAATD